ncbi:MAG: hypothetical protein HF982_02735 [Desulfobacteraceae bacterium]|nr:hypothetical protein [Desulfobacteraceae bacterium]MBC2718505.1 hypothetical protein [Desulfobacteraceae bacterium]
MKQKYLILNKDDQKELIIRELSVLEDKEALLLVVQKYDVKSIKFAISKGRKALVFVLRTKNLYPPSVYADKIAESVISMFKEKKQSIELLFDDIDLLTKKKSDPETFKKIEKESNEIDELIEDDFEEEPGDNLIKKDSLIIEDDKSL